MNHNIHELSIKYMSQEYINITKTWTTTIWKDIQKESPRHALSMCHTIHDTSLNKEHKIHTLTREETTDAYHLKYYSNYFVPSYLVETWTKHHSSNMA